jgi:hypothetical protein
MQEFALQRPTFLFICTGSFVGIAIFGFRSFNDVRLLSLKRFVLRCSVTQLHPKQCARAFLLEAQTESATLMEAKVFSFYCLAESDEWKNYGSKSSIVLDTFGIRRAVVDSDRMSTFPH